MTRETHGDFRHVKKVEVTIEGLRQAVNNASWRASTYIAYHEYVLKEDYPELYKAFQKYLLLKGYQQMLFRRWYRYFDLDNYSYWIVHPVLNRTTLEEAQKIRGERRA